MRSRGRPIIRRVNHRAHLSHLDQKLRRIGRHNQHIRMGLNQDAGLAFVRIPHVLARSHGLCNPRFEIRRLFDAHAVRAVPAKSGSPSLSVGSRQPTACASISVQARTCSAPLGPSKNQRLWEMVAAQPFAQLPHSRFIAMKVLESHSSSLRHSLDPDPGLRDEYRSSPTSLGIGAGCAHQSPLRPVCLGGRREKFWGCRQRGTAGGPSPGSSRTIGWYFAAANIGPILNKSSSVIDSTTRPCRW